MAASTVLVALVAAAAPSVRVETPVAGARQGEDAALLRELSERLLGALGSGGQSALLTTCAPTPCTPPLQPAPQAKLLVGSVPDDVGFDLPRPAASRLLGTGVRSIGREFRFFDVVLDVPEEAGDVVAFYRQALGELGWSESDIRSRLIGQEPSGFIDQRLRNIIDRPITPDPYRATFCPALGSQRPSLTVQVYASRSGMRDVRISGRPMPAFECDDFGPAGHGAYRLPALELPIGAESIGGGSGSSVASPDSISATGVARSAMSAADLEAHFAGQLEAAGWMRQAGGAEGITAWSAWSIPDRPGWHGFLTVTAEPGRQIRYLRLEARSEAADPPAPLPPGTSR